MKPSSLAPEDRQGPVVYKLEFLTAPKFESLLNGVLHFQHAQLKVVKREQALASQFRTPIW